MTGREVEAPSAEWTLLLYMSGVSAGLAHAEKRLIASLAGVAGCTHLDVVYEIATAEATRRGRIRASDAQPEVLFDGPRIDAASPAALASFVDWAGETFPSRYTALVLKGHGGGLDRPPTSRLPGESGVSNPYLGAGDVRSALERTRRGRVDLCGFDACDMGLLEVAYELRHVTSYLLATQSVEPSLAWPYRKAIDALCRDARLGPRALAEIIARGSDSALLSAIDLGWIEPLASSVDQIADAVTPVLWARRREVEAIRGELTSFGIENQYVDLRQLLDALEQVMPHAALLRDARTNLERACFAKTPMILAGGIDAGGLSIFFPRPSGSTYVASYGGLAIARENRWAGFVAELCFPSPGR